MLPDLSPTHIFIVVVVALIVVGPKDLPLLLRKIGKFVGQMRGMANEFRASFDEMARQSELDELRKEVEAMRTASQAAIPHDLGIAAAIQSDAESSFLTQWTPPHAEPAQSMSPSSVTAPQTTVGEIEATKAQADAPKPKRAPTKPRTPKAAAADAAAKAPAKPRTKKAKSAPEADA